MILPTCRELIEFLDDYVARRLPTAQRLAFDLHLAMCRDCRNYLSSYRQTVVLSKEAKESEDAAAPPMPPELVQAILDALKNSDSGRDGD
jgi:anti-sigma factor RsiW